MNDMKHVVGASPVITGFAANTKMQILSLDIPDEAQKRDQRRCGASGCKKKLALTDFPCKCSTKFCSAHRLPEEHSCTFDFKAAGKALLGSQRVSAVKDKIDRV
jgi:predicted nucleic acid binding AN1-type Zn finger protein